MSITGIRAARAYVELIMNDSKFTRGLALAEAEMRAFANKVTAIGTQMFGMGAAMLTPITYSVRQFKEFDDTMRLVRAVTRATMNDFQKLSDKARLLGKTTSFTSQQVADAMANLGRAGFDTKQIDGMIKHVMNLARATQTGIANSAEIVGNAMRQFGLQTKDTEKVVDVLTTTANNSSQTLDDIAQAMKYAAPIAKEFGLTIQDTAYYIGILANQGLRGEMAGTSLRNMLIRLSGADTQKKFTADLQVKIRDAEGRVKNIKQLLDEAGAAMNARGWDQLQRSKWLRDVFGLRAIAGGSKFVSVGDDFKYIMDAIADSEGAAERTAKQMDEGIGGAIRITISAFQELANVIGEAISPELIQFGKYLQGLANEWITYLKYHRNVVVEWTNFAAKIAKWGALLFGLGSVVRTIGSVFGGFVSAGKNMMVYFKAFSKASGDVDVEMKKVGSDTRKAGYDFGLASGEFKAAAKNMTDAAVLAVKAGDHIKNANTNIAKGGAGAEKAAARAERAGEMFETAAGHAKTAASAFASVNTQITDIGAVFTTAGTPMVNALKEFRKMVSFFSKSGESVVLAVQQIDALAGTLARFATSTNDAAYVFAKAAPVFSIYSRDLKTAGAAASKVLNAMGGFAVQAGEGVKTLGGAMETTAGAETTFASNTASVVSELEQVAASATKAGAAVKSVGTSMKGVQQYAYPIGPANLRQYASPIGPVNVGGMIKQKAGLEKQLAVHKDNLNNYYGTEIQRMSAYLAQLRSNPVLNADEIIRVEAKLKRFEDEAQKVRGSAFSLYGRSANISKQLRDKGYTTYRTKAEREKYGFRGISVYQQAQNSLKRAKILAEIERENAPNKTPGSAPSSYEVRKQLAIDAKNKQQTIWSKGFTSNFKIDGNVTRKIQELLASQEKLENIAKRNGLAKNEHGLWSSSNGRTSQKLVDLVNKTDEKYQARLHSLVRYQQLYNSPLATMRTIDTDILSPYPLAEDKDWTKEIVPKSKGLTGKQLREQQHLDVLMRRRASLVNRLHLNVLPTLSQDPTEQYKQLAESRKMQQRWAGQLAYVDKMIKDYGNRGVVSASQQLGSSKDADIAKLSVKPTEGAARAAALATAKYNEMKAATDQAGASLQKTGEAAKQTAPAVAQAGNAAKQGGAGFAAFSGAAKTAGLAVVGFAKALGGMLLFSAAFQGIWWAIGKLKEGAKIVTTEQENLDKLTQRFKEEQQQLQRLVQIQNAHEKTNELLEEAADIVGELQAKYGDLGLSVDRVKKSVEGLSNATEVLNGLTDAQTGARFLANDKAIEELKKNEGVLEAENRAFLNNMAFQERLPGNINGTPIYQTKERFDITDLVKKFANTDRQFFARDDWQELLEPFLREAGVEQNIIDSIKSKVRPVSYTDQNGMIQLIDTEMTDDLVKEVAKTNERNARYAATKQRRYDLEEQQRAYIEGINIDTEMPEAAAASLKIDFPNALWLGAKKIPSRDDILTRIYNGDFSDLTPEGFQDYRFGIIRAIDETKKERDVLDEYLKTNPVDKVAALQLTFSENESQFLQQVDSIKQDLERSVDSGSEEDQSLRVGMLQRLEEFRNAWLEAIRNATTTSFDFSKFNDVATYYIRDVSVAQLNAIDKQLKQIEKDSLKQIESVTVGNQTHWRIITGKDEEGNNTYYNNGEEMGYDVAKAIVTEWAGEQAKPLVEASQQLAKQIDAMTATRNIELNQTMLTMLETALVEEPSRVASAIKEAYETGMAETERKAGIGDELEYRFKNIEKWAEEQNKIAENVAETYRTKKDTTIDDLPIEEWLAAERERIRSDVAAMQEQARLEVQGDSTAHRDVGRTHDYLVEILRRMDRDYAWQRSRENFLTSYVSDYEKEKAALQEKRDADRAEDLRKVQESEENGLKIDGLEPREWLRQMDELRDNLYAVKLNQLLVKYGGAPSDSITKGHTYRDYEQQAHEIEKQEDRQFDSDNTVLPESGSVIPEQTDTSQSVIPEIDSSKSVLLDESIDLGNEQTGWRPFEFKEKPIVGDWVGDEPYNSEYLYRYENGKYVSPSKFDVGESKKRQKSFLQKLGELNPDHMYQDFGKEYDIIDRLDYLFNKTRQDKGDRVADARIARLMSLKQVPREQIRPGVEYDLTDLWEYNWLYDAIEGAKTQDEFENRLRDKLDFVHSIRDSDAYENAQRDWEEKEKQARREAIWNNLQLPEGLPVPAQEQTSEPLSVSEPASAEQSAESVFFDDLLSKIDKDDEKSRKEIERMRGMYKATNAVGNYDAADAYLDYIQSQTNEELPEGTRIGTKDKLNRRTWIKNVREKEKELDQQIRDQQDELDYINKATPYDTENLRLDNDIAQARERQDIARRIGNEQGVADEEAYIKDIERQKAENDYYKELDNVERLERKRNKDLKDYQKDQKAVEIQEKKIERMEKKGKDTAEERAKLEELKAQRDKSMEKYIGSNEQLNKSTNFIAAMNAYGNAQAQQQLWDINRSFSSKGTFDAYETGGQDVATWTAEFKEQTTILGNIEDYLATMASGEYL